MYNLSETFKASVSAEITEEKDIYETFELFLQCKWTKWEKEEKVK